MKFVSSPEGPAVLLSPTRTWRLIYDAAISAAYWPGASARATTRLRAAIAGAASRVLAYLFPEQPAQQLEADAEEAARAQVLAAIASPPPPRLAWT